MPALPCGPVMPWWEEEIKALHRTCTPKETVVIQERLLEA